MATLDRDGIAKQITQVQAWAGRLRRRFNASVASGTIGRIILAFGLSLALWVYVMVRDNPDSNRQLVAQSIAVRDLPSNLVLMQQGNLPPVDITITGPAGLVATLPQSITAYVDLSDQVPGAAIRVPVKVAVPAGLRWSVRPEEVTVDIEPLAQIEKPVQLSTPFASSSIRLDQPTIEPRVVTITGARSVVERVDRVIVRPELSGNPGDLTRTIKPVLLDRVGTEVTGPRLDVNPLLVTVTFLSPAPTGVKSVSVNPVLQGQLREGYKIDRINHTPPVVTIVGDAATLQAITTLETEPVDINNRQQSFELTAKLKIPSASIRSEVTEIKVEIAVSPILTRQTLNLPVVTRPRAGFRTVTSPSSIAVTFQGPVPRIRELDVSALRADVDVQNLGVGTHLVEPRIVGPGLDGLDRIEIQPRSVTVQIVADTPTTPTPIQTPSPSATRTS